MEWTYLLLAALIVALPFVLMKLFSGKSRDTDQVPGAYTPAARPAPAVAMDAAPIEARVKELLAQGEKMEAIKRIREQTGLGLKEAKELVDRLG